MKKYIKYSLLVLGGMIGLASCDKTEGPTYSEGDSAKASFFTGTASVLMKNGVINVPVSRPATTSDLSLPVTLTATGAGYLDVFSAKEPVKFAVGEAKAYAKIAYGDLSGINPSALSVTPSGDDATVGLAFPLTLSLPKESISLANVQTVSLSATEVLEFEDKGLTQLDSRGGWGEDIRQVKIHKAKGANVYKITKPFGGNTIAFQIKSDGKTITCPDQVVAIHSDYGPVSMTKVTGTVVGKIVTLNVGAYTVAAGSFGAAKEIITLP